MKTSDGEGTEEGGERAGCFNGGRRELKGDYQALNYNFEGCVSRALAYSRSDTPGLMAAGVLSITVGTPPESRGHSPQHLIPLPVFTLEKEAPIFQH